jgi:hypothetical protein
MRLHGVMLPSLGLMRVGCTCAGVISADGADRADGGQTPLDAASVPSDSGEDHTGAVASL